MKIVINSKYGGFELSPYSMVHLAKLKGLTVYPYLTNVETERVGNSYSAKVTYTLLDGKLANTIVSQLEVAEIPDGFDYKIINYDGIESLIYGNNLYSYPEED